MVFGTKFGIVIPMFRHLFGTFLAPFSPKRVLVDFGVEFAPQIGPMLTPLQNAQGSRETRRAGQYQHAGG